MTTGMLVVVVVLVEAMAVMMLDGDDDEQRREECGTQPEVRCSPLAPAFACDWVGSRHCAGLCRTVLCNVRAMMCESSGRG